VRESQRRVRQPENPTTPTGSDHGVDSEARSKKKMHPCVLRTCLTCQIGLLCHLMSFDLMVHSS
jgi:hypothetical protein